MITKCEHIGQVNRCYLCFVCFFWLYTERLWIARMKSRRMCLLYNIQLCTTGVQSQCELRMLRSNKASAHNVKCWYISVFYSTFGNWVPLNKLYALLKTTYFTILAKEKTQLATLQIERKATKFWFKKTLTIFS